MKYILFLYTTIIICACLLIGWRAKEEDAVNFSGILTPHDGAPMDVENIKINHKTEFYAYQKPEKKAESDGQIIPLEKNPTDTTEFGPFRLSTIKTIEVPSSEVEWVYQEPETQEEKDKKIKKSAKKYIEIIIDSTHYLVPKNTAIYATDKKTKQGIAIRKISHVKNLKITGYDLAEKEGAKIATPS